MKHTLVNGVILLSQCLVTYHVFKKWSTDGLKNGFTAGSGDGGGDGAGGALLYKNDGDWRGYAESEIHLTWREVKIVNSVHKYVGSFNVDEQVGTPNQKYTVDTGYGTTLSIGGGQCVSASDEICGGDGECKETSLFQCNAASGNKGDSCGTTAGSIGTADNTTCTGTGACVARYQCECKEYFAGEFCKKSLYDFGEVTKDDTTGSIVYKVNAFDGERTKFNVMLCMGALMIYSICHMTYLTLQSIASDKIDGFIRRLVSPVIIQQVLLYLTPVPTIVMGCLASLVTVTSIASFDEDGGYLQWRPVLIVLTLMVLSRSHSIRAKASIGFKDEIFSILASVMNLYYIHSLRVAASHDMIRLSSSIFAVFAVYEVIHMVSRVAHAMSAVGNDGFTEQFIGFIGSADVVDAFMGLTLVFTAFASFRRAANLYGGGDSGKTGSPFLNLGASDDVCAYVSADIGADGKDATSISNSWSDLPTCDTDNGRCCLPGAGDGSGWLVHLPWVSVVLCVVALFIKSEATIATLQNFVKSKLQMSAGADGVQSASSWRLGKRAARYSRIRVDTSG